MAPLNLLTLVILAIFFLIVNMKRLGPQCGILIQEIIHLFGLAGGQMNTMVKHLMKFGLMLGFMIVIECGLMKGVGTL